VTSLDAPALTIVSGRPSPEETAAVAVVLSVVTVPPSAAVTHTTGSEWAARARLMRTAVTPGPGAWRASALPR
jgi:hypothetical protein